MGLLPSKSILTKRQNSQQHLLTIRVPNLRRWKDFLLHRDVPKEADGSSRSTKDQRISVVVSLESLCSGRASFVRVVLKWTLETYTFARTVWCTIKKDVSFRTSSEIIVDLNIKNRYH